MLLRSFYVGMSFATLSFLCAHPCYGKQTLRPICSCPCCQGPQTDSKAKQKAAVIRKSTKVDPLTLPALVDPAALAEEHYQRALSMQQAEHGAEIEKELREAIRLQPRAIAYRRYLSGVLMNAGRNVEALAEAKLSIQVAPSEDYLYETLWAILVNMHRNEEAVEALKRGGQVATPQSPPMYEELARIYLKREDAENARKTVERGLSCYRLNPPPLINYKPELYYLLEEALWKEGKKAEARTQWQKAVALNLPQYTGLEKAKQRLAENP